ncbi:MAG: ethylbenzene dehydrogenase-related protein [Nitrospirales bacterium]
MSKKKIFVILGMSAALSWGLTINQVPLAVSQPVTIPVATIATDLPMDAANPIWESVPGVIVPLSGQTITTPMHPNISVKTVMIKMATNGKEFAVWGNWGDQTLNDTTIGPQDFRDQMAVQFPVQVKGAPPFQCMGQSGGSVNIWRWNAEWQKDLGTGMAGMWDVDQQYPSMAWDFYYEEPAEGVTYLDRIGRSAGPFNEGVWSGNIMSDPNLRISPVEDLNANGFSTLTTQKNQHVLGNGLWEPYGALKGGCCNGPTWRVVMKRALITDDPHDVQFTAGATIPVAFAVWDGSNVERNGMKGISTWFTAQLPDSL